MAPLTQTLSSNISLPPNSYIYKILSTSPRTDPLSYYQTDTLAILSSDDSLRFIDPATLNVLPDGVIKSVNESVTCLERADDLSSIIVATAGRDGLVKYWDRRSKGSVLTIQSPEKLISSIVCNNPRSFLACGTENPEDGAHESPVYIWDIRKPTTPQLTLSESHTDTITTLSLHPSHPTLLLTSSTDGLLSIFDFSQPNEEDALYQVMNHRSAVAHSGFLFPGTDIYALGTDETLSIYALQSSKEEDEEPAPRVLGDVRGPLGVEYVVKMHWVGDEVFVAGGKHSENYLDLIPLEKSPASGPLQYEFDVEKSIRLPGGHGEEIVRDVFTDVHSHTTYTCGEDGRLVAWKLSDADDNDVMAIDEPKPKKHKRKDKKDKDRDKKRKMIEEGGGKEKARYKPY
ncbi:WD40-repeat-containing domain protein [Clohesyomyces aquaticus]|uniref:WD40-repeat-containing domain protein n=1 Tax=Clohesyomyces aquaticus TaxID=1231657 RepID=A0A1Y2AA55_9PLEO|nr:WD40-repeat-containing domain protein [Clohesyomyces aquaticus]